MADFVTGRWSAELEDLFLRVSGRFGRVEVRRRMRDYVRGLLGPVSRDPDELRDDVQSYVAEKLGAPGGVLIVDDTGFVKKGTVSAGVQRQYSGTAGRTENCQIGVFAAYASSRGRALVDRELYLPKSWMNDGDRCRAARIPAERGFATKGELAHTLVLRALASSLPIAWVTADSLYGQEWRFRHLLEQAQVGYVLAVPKSQQLKSLFGIWRIDQVIADAPDDAWQILSCGDGAKGPRVYDWAAAKLPANLVFDPDPPTHERWVLARRSLRRPDEIAYYLAYAPVGTAVERLVGVAGSRWAIEECFQAAKGQCGLDQYEVRRYPGWYRHITLAMLAHAFLAAMAAAAVKKGAAETTQPAWPRSPWQRSGVCWLLSAPGRRTAVAAH
nr:IS701 family transposase [Streptomyces rimosus]